MNELRAKPGDLCMSDAMPFCQHHEYRTGYPLAEVLHDRFFLPMRGQLYGGDSITICQFEKDHVGRREARLLALVTVRVISSSPAAETVPLLMVGEIVRVDEPQSREGIERQAAHDAVEADRRRTKPIKAAPAAGPTIKFNVGSRKYEVCADGNTLARDFETREQAEAWMAANAQVAA